MSGSSLGIVHFASEMAPLAKVGGLADVVGALAAEQARRGHRVTVVLPRYASLTIPEGWTSRCLADAEVPWGMGRERAAFELFRPKPDGAGETVLQVLLVDHAGERKFFAREGIYDDPGTMEGYPDNAERFLFFARAALEGLKRLDQPFDVLHAHDHQAGWVPCLARTHESESASFAAAATVFTIHNLGYQGIHDSWVLGLAGFGRELFYPQSPFEFFGRVNYMKVGIAFADMISTVSPQYAREIQNHGEFGCGLEGVLRRRNGELRGILNGIDDRYWNPASDPYLPHPYDRATPAGKWKNRTALIAECGFPATPDWPLIGMISRLVDQKGFDLIEQAEADLMRLEARFVILGAGQARYLELVSRLASEHPERVHHRSGEEEPFAHRIEAGCDLYLMPSRYEPCGLNQMYSLRYGTVPVARATGGLADTIEDFDPATRQGTGFLFHRYEGAEMIQALRRALMAYRQPHLWSQLRANGMARDFSWRVSADGYDDLYAAALDRVRAGQVATLDSVRASI
ncbi:MAG TPA: glycogen/starch synthase [Candidatus Limnocylindria bacterium]|nr:glycogen/starch synthase [Candidatus Limnocylindria bacterium]